MLDKIDKIVGKISKGLAQISMWAIFTITFILVVDIVLRFTTETMSILGTYELTELFMIVIIYLSLAVTQYDKDHIHVVMLIEKFPWRLRTFIETVIFAFTAYLCYMLFYAAALQAQTVGARGMTTQVLFIPQLPFVILMAIGLFVLAVVFTLDTVKYAIMAITNKKPANAELTEAQKIVEETERAMES